MCERGTRQGGGGGEGREAKGREVKHGGKRRDKEGSERVMWAKEEGSHEGLRLRKNTQSQGVVHHERTNSFTQPKKLTHTHTHTLTTTHTHSHTHTPWH